MPIIALSEDREACHNVCNNSTKLVVSWRWSGLAFSACLGTLMISYRRAR